MNRYHWACTLDSRVDVIQIISAIRFSRATYLLFSRSIRQKLRYKNGTSKTPSSAFLVVPYRGLQSDRALMGGTGGRRPAMGLGILSTLTAALPTLTTNLALELAPVRMSLIAAGFVDTQLSASLLGDQLENRRSQLRAKLPIRRVVQPADVAALALRLMINTALTGATYDIDGGQQFVAA